jgi:hypothetical protein
LKRWVSAGGDYESNFERIEATETKETSKERM